MALHFRGAIEHSSRIPNRKYSLKTMRGTITVTIPPIHLEIVIDLHYFGQCVTNGRSANKMGRKFSTRQI